MPPPRTLPAINYWLPKTEEERREGFYVCLQMLQLMEDVFLDFDLDQYYDHIDNRGWMNLFQHWAWSGMLTATFAVTEAVMLRSLPVADPSRLYRIDLVTGAATEVGTGIGGGAAVRGLAIRIR